ncbi:hypothetical protein BUALT_Bualt07G0092500 [Buddleja alternifolia]|uniref:NAC domain-containing protein n=1 Tax=Buddleja alternifolia TaxID=168488 RepID=A0AAV6X9I7_9LAMI|nr:hypothetical protein BUALT_Bualt07G0092500 [Buddleja alternifolia]
MDKLNFVKDGGSKLPPGFRFEPTDEEIVFQYLARKIFSHPLPASVIPEINVFSFDPWDLPGDSEQDRYYFSNKETNYRNINRASKATCGGYWKVTGSYKQIICSKRMPIMGIKKTLLFYKGKHHHTCRTDWFMHVYCIAISGNSTPSNVVHKNNSQGSLIQIGNWVLCHVFSKKRSTKTEFGDSMTEDTSDTDSSSASSSSSSLDSDSSVLSEVSSSSANDGTS